MGFATTKIPSSKIPSMMKARLASAAWFAFFLLRHAGNCQLVSFSLKRVVGEWGYPVAYACCWYLF